MLCAIYMFYVLVVYALDTYWLNYMSCVCVCDSCVDQCLSLTAQQLLPTKSLVCTLDISIFK